MCLFMCAEMLYHPQRLMLEMQQMARRPFSHVNVELDGCLDVEMELGKREAKGCSADYSLRHRGKVSSVLSGIHLSMTMCLFYGSAVQWCSEFGPVMLTSVKSITALWDRR